jgi:3',5'-nucleoside bisphosphate phosphatase
MEKTIADLHTHTYYSDGFLGPKELLQRAHKNHVAALAITDHETVEAYKEPGVLELADKSGIELVPGIEISTVDEEGDRFHVLGLFIDPENPSLNDRIEMLRLSRQEYAHNVCQLLHKAGWAVDMDSLFKAPIITKAHIASNILNQPPNIEKLVNAFGPGYNRGQFIESYMTAGRPFFVPRAHGINPQQAVEIIHKAEGLAFIAHPVACLFEGLPQRTLKKKIEAHGYDGIEAIYYYHNKSKGDVEINETKQFLRLAKKLGLLVCGGSDFHGDAPELGRVVDVGFGDRKIVPTLDLVNSLKQAAQYRLAKT